MTYPVHAITRNSFGEMTRKLSETESAYWRQFCGTNRSMFGTNLPVDRLFSAVEHIFLVYETVLNAYPRAEQDALQRGNAETAYRI